MTYSRYANITQEQKDRIVRVYKSKVGIYPTGQAVAITAAEAWELSDRQWNSKKGSDIFAATLATLVMSGNVELVGGM